MRGLHSSKTIPSNADKKSSTHIARQLPSLHNSQLIFEKIHSMIVPSDYLPINLEVEDKDLTEIELIVTHQSMTAKQRNENVSIPINIQNQKWTKIKFGQQCRRVVIRPLNGYRRFDKKLILTENQHWKQQQKQQMLNCYPISIQSVLLLLKVKGDKQRRSEIGYKNSISSFMKTKFSERGNLKPSNVVAVKRQNSIRNDKEQEQKKQLSAVIISRARKHDSQTLELENLIEDEKKKERRESNASTSIRVESRDIKFSRRIKKLRELAESKNIYSQKQTLLDDTSDLFPQTKIKARFYQHINLSQEQIDVKRRKFDSQFITKKSAIPSQNFDIPDKECNQSEVTQDICKMEGSKSLHPLEDTLEQGIRMAQNNPQPTQESGTLCESVYQ